MKGVKAVLDGTERSFYICADVVNLLGVSRNTAYSIIRGLRKELIDDGRLTPIYPSGRIPKKYFDERCMMK